MVIEARRAADLLGATKMDRRGRGRQSETNKVYAYAHQQRPPQACIRFNAANPRPENKFGHIVEMTPDNLDHAGTKFRWDILVKCGDPSVAAVGPLLVGNDEGRLVRYARQLRRRQHGPFVDHHGRKLGRDDGPLRRGLVN